MSARRVTISRPNDETVQHSGERLLARRHAVETGAAPARRAAGRRARRRIGPDRSRRARVRHPGVRPARQRPRRRRLPRRALRQARRRPERRPRRVGDAGGLRRGSAGGRQVPRATQGRRHEADRRRRPQRRRRRSRCWPRRRTSRSRRVVLDRDPRRHAAPSSCSSSRSTRSTDRRCPTPTSRRRSTLQKKIQQAVITGNGVGGRCRRRSASRSTTPEFQSLLTFDPAKVMPDVRPADPDRPGRRSTRRCRPSNADRLEALARKRKNAPPVEVVKVPGVNHLLVPATTGEVDEYASLPDKHVSPAVTRRDRVVAAEDAGAPAR